MNESIPGKYLLKQLEEIHQINILDFQEKEKELKDQESVILSQKNILSEVDYNQKVKSLKNKIDKYKKNRKEKIDSVSKKKVDATSKLLNEINPILTNYSKEKGISIILRKKHIIIAKSNLDITEEIIKLVNLKVKKINLNC